MRYTSSMHPRNHRISNTLTVAAVVLVMLAAGSLFVGVDVGGRVGVVCGIAYVFRGRIDLAQYAVWLINPRRTMPQRLGDAVGPPRVLRKSGRAISGVELPLVWPAAVCGLTAYVVRRRGRIPPGHCRCGYDLTGNVSGTCPECGAVVAPRCQLSAE